MRLDVTLVLYWGSLGLSAAAVVLFLWLMRTGRKASDVRRESKQDDEKPAGSA